MKKNLTMQLLPLWLLAFFFFASVPMKAQTNSEATPKVGIIKQIGCGTGNEAEKAQIQVIHDGTGYNYNFGANATAISSNTAWVPAGARTIVVTKGSKTYNLPITVPAKAAVPTFTPTITYNCNGTADVLLTNNQGTYNYTYTYGSNTHNSPYFTGLAVGQQHTVTVKYTAPPTTKSIVFYDDFGKYDGGANSVKSPYVNQTIFFDPMDGTAQVKPDGSTRPKTTNDSYYAIGRRAELSPGTPNNSWILPNDKDKDPNGRYLWYNVALTPAEKTVYKRKAKVRSGLPIEFSAYVYNPINAAKHPTGYLPEVFLKIFRSEADFNSDTPMYSSDSTEAIPKETNLDNWTPISVTTNVGNADTELIFVIYINGGGNDLCVDNILVTQPSTTCEQTLTVPVNVVTNTNVYSTTVAYNCAANNGTITVAPSVTTGYDYTYSLNGGTPQTSGIFVKNAGSYTITVTSKVKGSKILFKEDFGSGGTYLMPTSVIPTPFVGRLGGEGYPSDILAEGNYQIANQGNLVQRTTWNWLIPLDHTSNGTKTDGRYLAFNYGANATSYFYLQDIQVTPNKPITIEYYVYNLNKSNVTTNLPNIETTFWNKATNTLIAFSTKVSGNITGNTHNKDWRKVTHTFTPPVGVTDLQLRFKNTNNDTSGNDFAIDDILVTQDYDTCTTTLTATVAPKVTSAFAGVTKLIGCGTGANANKAEVTIANVEGGIGAYEYNFDGTWVATNTSWLAAGTHTVSVRAAGTGNSCAYDMSVTVPNPIAQPTIKTEVFYNCEGKPILKVGVQSPVDELTYLYKLDNGAFTTTYVFTDISTGTHSVSVQFNRRQIASPYILMKEDFGKGEPMSLGTIVPSNWNFQPANGTVLAGDCLHEGYYTVAPHNKVQICSTWCWTIPKDHTSNGTDATGRFYAMNVGGAASGQRFYYKDVDDIKPNVPIKYEMYLMNLLNTSCAPHPTSIDANIEIRIVDKNNPSHILDTKTTGRLPRATNALDWRKYEGTLNTGSVTSIRIEFRDLEAGNSGNDFAIDDITVYQDPDICGQEVTTTATITPLAKPSFSANVSNCSNTNSTITWVASPTTGYTYTYTIQGGTATSSNVFNGLATGTYTFTINYAPVSNTIVLLDEDFGAGTEAVNSPYAGGNLFFNTNKPGTYVAHNNDGQTRLHTNGLEEKEYTIAHLLIDNNTNWNVPADASGITNGRMFFLNPTTMSPNNQDVYVRDLVVLPNSSLTLSAKFYNLLKYAGTEPQVQLAVYDKKGGTLIKQTPSYTVPHSTAANSWYSQTLELTAQEIGNHTSVYMVVRMVTPLAGGYDLAVDDIIVKQTIACQTTLTATVANQVQKAFAGVTKLIGCGTAAEAGKAEVTIANVEGGSGTYEYSFDNGLSWVTTNAGWVPAGTHTVSVRDGISKSCAYDMSVTVPAALAQPTIKTEVFYACDGKAILNVGVANPDPELTYMYSLDGAAFTTTYVYTNVASGTHSISVQYEYASAPSPVMLLKETFGSSASDGCLDPGMTTYICQAGNASVPSQGAYGIINGNSGLLNRNIGGAPCTTSHPGDVWVPVKDHTSMGADTNGRFFMVDAKYSSGVGDLFYKKTVKDIPLNSNINVEFFILNLFRQDKEYHSGLPVHQRHAVLPNIRVLLKDTSNNEIAHFDTGEVSNSVCGAGLDNWKRMQGTLNSGNNSEFTIEFIANQSVNNGWGNDFCIDDITVFVEPKACGQVVSTTKVVTANNQDIPAFTVSKTYNCATGKGVLTVTPTATTGFTYTYTLGSTTYTSTTATFTGLDLEQTYTVSISYQAVSNTITLLNEDFGVGTTATDAVKSPYIGEDWYFNKNTTESYSTSNGKGQSKVHPANKYLDNQEYTIAPEFILNSNSNDWIKPVDKSGNANGRKLFVDGHATLTTEANLYLREIGVLPNQPLTFTTDFFNVISLAKTAAANNPIVQPQVRLQLYESEKAFKDGNAPLKQTNIYHVPAGSTATVADWKTQTLTLSSTEVGNRTKLFAVIKMYNLQHSGHDLAVDNIVITQKLSACATTVTATLTKADVATPTLTLPANLSVICSAPTASATISSWIASAVATSTCGTATVTHNYVAPANLCNVSGNAVSVTFTTTDAFGNVTTGTRVITFGTMTLTVTPTALSVPNGATGGTTSSVVPNITLGGVASPSTNSVTITFSGLPTGVTTNTNGQLVIPAGTPAGTHTITYRVCETAGHNNCKTVTTTLVIGAATPTVSTETFTASTTTATVVPGVIGNILTNATVGTQSATVGVGGNVTITLTHTPTTPNAPVLDPSTGNVRVSGNTPPGVYTITYNLCSAVSTCVPGVATVTVPQLKPYVPNTTITHSGTTTTTRNILDGATVNGGTQSATVGVGGTVSITNVTNPTPQTPGAPVPTLNPLTGIVTVPPTTPSGTYTISYTVCTTATPTNCTTGVTTVVVGNVTPTVVPDGFTASTTTATVVPGVIGNVLTNDRVGTQSATVGVGGNVTINVTHTPTTPNAPVLDPSTGNVTVGSNTPAGVYTISYQVCSGAACTPATVTVTVPQLKPYVPNTTITHSGTTTTTRNILDGATVNGGTQSATVGVGGTVSITNVTNPTPQTPGAPVPTLNPSTGIVTVPPTTPSGVYTISYTVCTTATPTNCTTGVTTVVVGNVTPTVVPDGFTASTTTATVVPGVIGNVLTNDRVGTQSATVGVGGNVTINVTHTPTTPNAPVLDPSTGNVTVGGNTPAGVYTISYQVCSGAACTPATVTVTVPQLKPYVPNTTITHSGTTTTTRNILDGATVNGGTQSATVGVGGTVSITNVTNPTPQTPGAPVPTLNPLTGIVTVPPTTPSGVYTISYTVCTTATPTNCTTGVTTVVVSNVTPTVVPSATNVTAHTRVNTPVNIGVTSSTTVTVSIPSQPANGTAVDNGDGTITYTPNNGFKGIDSFEYRLCNASGCHTATISVRVTNELVIYTGVSVGGDKNNHFHIEGIENYPNNIVRIYNRWGVKVFEVSGYNNTTKVFKGVSDARATLEASDNLPQGTYYYIIEYHDEANKKQTEVGWLYLKKN